MGLYKTECTRFEGPWRGVDDLELATLSWVHWFNQNRLHSALEHVPPIEFEAAHHDGAVAACRCGPGSPWRNDMVTTTAAGQLPCPVCSSGFTPIRRQRFCSPAYRQAAWRARQPAPIALSDPGPTGRGSSRRRSPTTPAPSAKRYLAEQWCPDCNHPCRRLGSGGLCPFCEEPITVDELLGREQNQTTSPANPG